MGRTNATDKKRPLAQARFCAHLRDGYSITAAASVAGVDRRTVYRWREDDPAFADEWDDAYASRGDWYEDRNRDAAASGQMAAILNGLRIHRRIVDRQEITGANGAPFYVVMQEGLPEDVYGYGGSDPEDD